MAWLNAAAMLVGEEGDVRCLWCECVRTVRLVLPRMASAQGGMVVWMR